MSTGYTAAHLLLSTQAMRLVLFLLVLAGCPSTTADSVFSPGDDGSGGAPAECAADYECAASGARCCDCPTFAVPRTDPAFEACLGVACPTPTACPSNVAPACRQGQCVLACVPVACANSCDDGFALDGNGCLTCDCAQVTDRECSADSDCARVPADCCGCARGGVDTAVPDGAVATHDASLGCPPSPSCPGVDSCAPDLAPRCVQGACQLISRRRPPGACGRTDLAACAMGQACTVNSDDAATARGVGVCVPPT